jgi:hypothetical protein
VILQPSYIPWRGYFDLIHAADVFIFYDDVQYDKHGWRNRNRIKAPSGTQWLTIPVLSKGNVTRGLRIDEVRIDRTQNWAGKHWTALRQVYGKTPHFARYAPALEPFYREPPELLAELAISLTTMISRDFLGISHTRFERASRLGIDGTQTGRLVALARAFGATRYLSGPAAHDYLDEGQFGDAGIALEYIRYDYPEYPQRFPPFEPSVSVLDLLFMVGPDAPRYIWDAAPTGSGRDAPVA